jgi:hypothetical protein
MMKAEMFGCDPRHVYMSDQDGADRDANAVEGDDGEPNASRQRL